MQIGSGSSGFCEAQRFTSAAVREGIQSPAVKAFASLGADGSHPSNIERDGHRWMHDFHGMRLSSIKLNVCKDGIRVPILVPILSVHQMMGRLWHAGPMQRAISLLGLRGEKELVEFWERAQHTSWGKGHPCSAWDINCRNKTIGLIFHCDGVEVLARSCMAHAKPPNLHLRCMPPCSPALPMSSLTRPPTHIGETR